MPKIREDRHYVQCGNCFRGETFNATPLEAVRMAVALGWSTRGGLRCPQCSTFPAHRHDWRAVTAEDHKERPHIPAVPVPTEICRQCHGIRFHTGPPTRRHISFKEDMDGRELLEEARAEVKARAYFATGGC
jgi:hypothetical protein